MRIVAVVATYAVVIHLTLDVRSVDINFFVDLSVVMVEAIFEDRGFMGVEERLAMNEGVLNQTPVRVAPRTSVDLCIGLFGVRTHRLPGLRIEHPMHRFALLELGDESHVQFAEFARIFRSTLCPV